MYPKGLGQWCHTGTQQAPRAYSCTPYPGRLERPKVISQSCVSQLRSLYRAFPGLGCSQLGNGLSTGMRPPTSSCLGGMG